MDALMHALNGAQWRQYWNVTKPVLLEKSPRHILMTRILQHWFTHQRSYFIVILRHPLAAGAYAYIPQDNPGHIILCMGWMVSNWLHEYGILFNDLKHIRHKIVVHFEHFAQRPQQYLDAIFRFLSMSPNVVVDVGDGKARRHFHGSRNHAVFHSQHAHNWQQPYITAKSKWNQSECDDTLRKYEGRVNQYGYSLLDLDLVTVTEYMRAWTLQL